MVLLPPLLPFDLNMPNPAADEIDWRYDKLLYL
jgi:hypothetical protein